MTKLRFKDSKFKGCCMYKVIDFYILGGFYVGYSRRIKRYKAARNFMFKQFYV